MFPTTKKNCRQVIRCQVPYGDDFVFASALVIWGRQSPHVSYDSPRAFEQPIRTTVRRLGIESAEGFRIHPTKSEYRAIRNYVLDRASALKGVMA
jgi:hypothetical protein